MHTLRVKVPESGPLSVPEDVLRAAGAKPGDEIELQVIETKEPERSVREIVTEIQAISIKLLAGQTASVDEFLAERRAEAARE